MLISYSNLADDFQQKVKLLNLLISYSNLADNFQQKMELLNMPFISIL